MTENQDILRRLTILEQKIDTMSERVLSQHLCSAPNTCLALKEQFAKFENEQHEVRVRLLGLERWQAWLTGIGVILLGIMTFFGPIIRRVLNLE